MFQAHSSDESCATAKTSADLLDGSFICSRKHGGKDFNWDRDAYQALHLQLQWTLVDSTSVQQPKMSKPVQKTALQLHIRKLMLCNLKLMVQAFKVFGFRVQGSCQDLGFIGVPSFFKGSYV